MKSSKEKLNDFVAFGSLPLEAVALTGIDMVDFAEAQNAWNEYCNKLEKEFNCKEALKQQIAFGENKIRELKKKYGESKQKGEPYEERKNILALIEYIKRRIQEWYEMGRNPKPIKEWLVPDDYPRVKEIGINEFFKRYAR